MELSIGEMLMVMLAIVVLFGPDKIPEIARGLGEGVRKMRGAMEDVKSEIMKETENPVSEIKKEIEKVKQAAREYDPMNDNAKNETATTTAAQPDQLSDDYNGPVSR